MLPQVWLNVPSWLLGVLFWLSVLLVLIGIVWLTSMHLSLDLHAIWNSLWPIGRKLPGRVPLLALRDEAAKRGWDFGSESLEIADLADAIMQAGMDGSITLWGRDNRNMYDSLNKQEVLEKVPPSHWKDFKISANFQTADDNFEVQSYSARRSAENRDDWKGNLDLHIEKAALGRWLRVEAEKFRGRN